ncbi:MAG TPA: hypothetical protein VFY14_10220 [Streptomyces sp.]|nr:hypothetical protein [Streptomyces sp.]
MSADHTPDPTRTRRRGLTTVSVALAVLLAGGGGAYWATTASGGGTPGAPGGGARGKPSPLVLDGYGELPDAGAERGFAPGEPDPGGGPVYKAAGPLPGGPSSAPAYRPAGTGSEAGRRTAVRLAEALGLPGEVRGDGKSWRAGGGEPGGGPALTVVTGAPGTWTFTGPEPGTEAGPDVEGPSAAEARKAAGPVLRALGLEGAALDPGPRTDAVRTVRVDPRQDGLPTHGWATELRVDHHGKVVGGSGRLPGLAKTDEDPEYPVMSAEDTLAALNERGARVDLGLRCAAPPGGETPEPWIPESGAVEPDSGGPGTPEPGTVKPGTSKPVIAEPGTPEPGTVGPADGGPGRPGSTAPCGPTGKRKPVKVTGAVFGLSAHLSRGRHILVPSWLFEVAAPNASSGGRGEKTYTVAHPAVEPEFLAPPSSLPGGDDPTSAPAEPDRSPPLRAPAYVEGYAPGDTELTVHFWGGVCDDHRATAQESAKKVTVRIEVRPKEPGGVCILVAREMTATVTLKEPVGDRRLVDERGERVPERPRA